MRQVPLASSWLLAVIALAGLFGCLPLPLQSWLLWLVAVPAAAVAVNELLGKPVPFLRWSFLRMMLGMGKLLEDWQVGDGREQRVALAFVFLAHDNDAYLPDLQLVLGRRLSGRFTPRRH